MAKEIEHKYLVINDNYKSTAFKRIHIRQGYLSRDPERTVRIRITDMKGFLTVKGKNNGDSRLEFEYEIPLEEAEEMLMLCQPPTLEKYRYLIDFRDHLWEVDEYLGRLAPLVVAEVELKDSSECYDLPDFVGENVTGNERYYNSNLVG